MHFHINHGPASGNVVLNMFIRVQGMDNFIAPQKRETSKKGGAGKHNSLYCS